NVAQIAGVRRLGGSRSAMVGGAVGVFVGPLVLAALIGPFALLVGPPVGAVAGTLVGENVARRRRQAAAGSVDGGAHGAQLPPNDRASYRRLGMGALLAYLVSTGLKLGIIVVQVVLLWVCAR
ncbi:MAG: hypothetical protein JWN41_987, partial [Thermoleophilia bacterium]|nr:hypothetical protein [Thermoleophilia bacterium]